MIGKKILRWTLTLITIVVITIAVAVTPMGTRFILFSISKTLPGKLYYQSESGILSGVITLKNVRYTSKHKQLTIKKMAFEWQPLKLFVGELAIKKLQIDHIKYSDSNKEPVIDFSGLHKINATQWVNQQLDQFKLPIDLTIKQAAINDLYYGNNHRTYPNHIQYVRLNGAINSRQLNLNIQARTTKPYIVQLDTKLEGTPTNYTLTTQADNQYFKLLLKGVGTAKQFHLTATESDTLDGKLTGSLQLTWPTTVHWNVKLNAKKLNLGKINDSIPNGINLNFASTGQVVQKNQLQLAADLAVSTPNTHITIKASNKKQWQIQWQANVNKLSQLAPNAQGSIQSQGFIRSFNKPITTGKLTINNLQWDNNAIKNIQSQWNIKPDDRSSKITASGSSLLIAKHLTQSFHLDIAGDYQQQSIAFKLANALATLNLQAKTHAQDKTWLANINHYSIHTQSTGLWKLEKPAELTVASNKLLLTPLCLVNNNKGKLCTAFSWQKDDPWSLNIRGQQVDINLFSALLNPNLNFHGTANIDVNAKGMATDLKVLDVSLQSSGGSIDYQTVNNLLKMKYDQSIIKLNYDSGDLVAITNIKMPNNSYIDSNVTLPDFDASDQLSEQSITGKANIHITNLSFLSALIPDYAIPNGNLTGNAIIKGTLGKPSITGKLNLQNGNITMPSFGLKLTQIAASIKAKDHYLLYKLSANSSGKVISIDGKTDLNKDNTNSKLNITGNHVLLYNTPEYQIYASPDISINVDNHMVNITGKVTIPEAHIKPHKFTNTVTLPENEVEYIGAPEENQTKWQVSSNIKLLLGDDVNISAMGIKGVLSGSLQISSSPGRIATADGQITMNKGVYDAYGQKLTIEKGSSVTYSNSPLGNPTLNIRAFKVINTVGAAGQQLGTNNIIVGINLRNSVHSPKIQLFSMPANMSQTDILSYLVLGYATYADSSSDPTNTNQQQNQGASLGMLLQAASLVNQGVSTTQMGSMVDNLKKGLGFSEFGVETSTQVDALGTPVGQQTAFVIGKHLSKQIYLRYSMGLGGSSANNLSLLQLRYLLGPHWTVQLTASTDSGSNENSSYGYLGNGIDVLYTIEKN